MIKAAIFEAIQKGPGVGCHWAGVGRAYYKTPASKMSLEAPITDEVLPLWVFITVCAPSRGLSLKLAPWSTHLSWLKIELRQLVFSEHAWFCPCFQICGAVIPRTPLR